MVEEAGALGAADVRALVEVDATFLADPSARAVHDRRFAAFRKLHRAQRGVLARLNRP